MFDDLSRRLEQAVKSFKGEDKITQENIEPALKAVKKALVEADVNLLVAKEFLEDVRKEAIGVEVVRGVTPDQKFIDVVHKCLIHVMGDENQPLNKPRDGTRVIMLVGLQGAGKTTAAAKLGLYLKERGEKVSLVAADTFRPAAKEQLLTLGRQVGLNVAIGGDREGSVEIAKKAIKLAEIEAYNTVIVDTAGRLYIDQQLMNEIEELKNTIDPHEILLVVDSMIGQEAAELTRVFNERLGLTGAILTKLDGDSRGGAALSIKKVSGKPIKFIGTGEKVEALEPFYPERLASRILGMGDILTLVDKAQKEVDLEDVISMQKKFEEASFDFTDFLKQMKLIKRMGSIGGLMKLLPGMNKIDERTLKNGEIQLKKVQSMINSMTAKEQKKPELLMKSHQRRRRIAVGSGYSEAEVDKVVSDFQRMREMMQSLAKGNIGALKSGMLKSPKFSDSQSSEFNSGKSMRKRDTKKKKGFFEL